MGKIRYISFLVLTGGLLLLFCTNSFCATSKMLQNQAGVTYLHSNGDTPSSDEEYADGTAVVLPVLSNLCQAKGKIVPIDTVFGLRATISDTLVTLSWNPVSRYTDLDTYVKLQAYTVYYSAVSGSGYQMFAVFNSQTLSCTHLVGVNSPTYYYTVVAVDDMQNTSGFSVETDKSNNIYVHRDDALTSGDSYTALYISQAAATVLYQGGVGNPYPSDNIFIEVKKQGSDEGKAKTVGNLQGLVATSMSFNAYRYTNRDTITNFIFPKNVSITMRYEIDENGLVKNTRLLASQAKTKLGLYYFNGLEWVKIPAGIDTAKHTLTATVNHLSKYALISGASNATKLTLTKRIPPIFTPNGDHTNDYVFFYYEGYQPTSRGGKIFDLSGSLVREITEDVPGQMKWDGKNSAGDIMESGIYIYQIQAGTEFISGSVVLAK